MRILTARESQKGIATPDSAPGIHGVLVSPVEAQAIASGEATQLCLGELGVMSVATVYEHDTRSGHYISGITDGLDGQRRPVSGDLYKRSLLGKLFGRSVHAYVSLGEPIGQAVSDE